MKIVFSQQEINEAMVVYWGGELLNDKWDYEEGGCRFVFNEKTGVLHAEIEITRKQES